MKKGGRRLKRRTPKKTFLMVSLTLLCITLSPLIVINLLKSEPDIPIDPDSELQTENDNENLVDNVPMQESTHVNSRLARKDQCYTFLLAASDQSSGNADTIMVVTFDTLENTVGVASIPRDTLINPDDGFSSFPKINSTYLKGIDNLSAAVSDLLGIPIDFFITVDINGFIELIDSIGGIDFDIPIHMSYDDPTQDLHIHFEPGITNLDGEETLNVCRLRYNNDGTLAYPDYDIGRTRTQQGVLLAVAKKVFMNPQKINKYLEIFQTYANTNLSFRNALWFVAPFLSLDFDQDISFYTLPGDGTVTYKNVRYCYELDPEKTLTIVNDALSPYEEPISLNDMNLFSASIS